MFFVCRISVQATRVHPATGNTHIWRRLDSCDSYLQLGKARVPSGPALRQPVLCAWVQPARPGYPQQFRHDTSASWTRTPSDRQRIGYCRIAGYDMLSSPRGPGQFFSCGSNQTREKELEELDSEFYSYSVEFIDRSGIHLVNPGIQVSWP